MLAPRSSLRSLRVHNPAIAMTLAGGLAFAASSLAPRVASAQEECPIGSVQKTENAQTWCEPTICATDTNCATGLICRPVALCVEIGALTPGAKDAGQRLLVRQRCGEAKSCPQNTTCSEASRCVTKAQAEKAGLLTAGAASGAPPGKGDAPSADPPKKSCGCHVPGASSGSLAGSALALLAGLVVVTRRRSSRSRRS